MQARPIIHSPEPRPSSHSPAGPADDAERGEPLSLPGRPRRVSRRIWLLSVTALFTLAIIVAAHAVLLPFILALVLAYVCLPGVLWLERKRVPRWVAIVGIYVMVLGVGYGFVALTAPRIVREVKGLTRDMPGRIRQIRDVILPAWEAKVLGFAGIDTGAAAPAASAPALSSQPAAAAPSAGAPLGAPSASISATPGPGGQDTPNSDADNPAPANGAAEAEERKSAFHITTRDDGSADVDMGSGILVSPTDDGGYRINPADNRRRGGLARAFAYVERHYMQLARGGLAVVSNIARSIFLFFMTLMLAAYMMLTYEQIIGFFRGLVRPAARADFDRVLERIDRGLAGVVRGQLLICLVNGVLTAVGFAVIGVKYWPVLSIVAAVGSLIPIFGAILSSIPAVAIGLTQSAAVALLVLSWIVVIHQIEANFLNPKIIGTSAHLHPVLIIFALLAGEHWFQVPGALLAVPCLSIGRSLFNHFREVADRDEPAV